MYVKLLKEKQMKKGLKIAAIVVGVIIILMLLLPFAFQGKIAGIVKTEGNKMLNAQFDFKKLNISLFRNFPQASVTLEDFWLKGAGEFANDTLVQAGEVTATINLFSLFGDSGYDISKVFIEDTRLHAIVLPDGRANWDIEARHDRHAGNACRGRRFISFQSQAATFCHQEHEFDL